MTAFLAETIGTTFISLLGCGVVTLGIHTTKQFSGANLNPVVTLVLAYVNWLPWANADTCILAKFIGAIIGSLIAFLVYYPHFKLIIYSNTVLITFSTRPAICSNFHNFVCESIAAFILVVFTIICIGVNYYTDGINSLVVGGLILGLGLSFCDPNRYIRNLARDLCFRAMCFMLPIKHKQSSNWGLFLGSNYYAGLRRISLVSLVK